MQNIYNKKYHVTHLLAGKLLAEYSWRLYSQGFIRVGCVSCVWWDQRWPEKDVSGDVSGEGGVLTSLAQFLYSITVLSPMQSRPRHQISKKKAYKSHFLHEQIYIYQPQQTRTRSLLALTEISKVIHYSLGTSLSGKAVSPSHSLFHSFCPWYQQVTTGLDQ